MKKWLLTLCESKLVRTLGPALAGFIGYGSWGFFCNMMHGWQMGLWSGLVQGSLSFTITLVFNTVMETIYGALKRKIISVVLTVAGLIAVSFTVNTLAGTPEVIATIAPGAVIGGFYVYSFISVLERVAKAENSSAEHSGS